MRQSATALTASVDSVLRVATRVRSRSRVERAARSPRTTGVVSTTSTSSSGCSSDRGSNSRVLVTIFRWSVMSTVPARHSASESWPVRAMSMLAPASSRVEPDGNASVKMPYVSVRSSSAHQSGRVVVLVSVTVKAGASLPTYAISSRPSGPTPPEVDVTSTRIEPASQLGRGVAQRREPQPARDPFEREDRPLLAVVSATTGTSGRVTPGRVISKPSVVALDERSAAAGSRDHPWIRVVSAPERSGRLLPSAVVTSDSVPDDGDVEWLERDRLDDGAVDEAGVELRRKVTIDRSGRTVVTAGLGKWCAVGVARPAHRRRARSCRPRSARARRGLPPRRCSSRRATGSASAASDGPAGPRRGTARSRSDASVGLDLWVLVLDPRQHARRDEPVACPGSSVPPVVPERARSSAAERAPRPRPRSSAPWQSQTSGTPR